MKEVNVLITGPSKGAEMKRYTPDELVTVLAEHKKWLEDNKTGNRANLQDANLRGADLRDANLQDADLRDANLRDANLRGADLRDANLQDANLQDADLRDANLQGAYLQDANLRDANLLGTDLRGAYLQDANLQDADLRDANLQDADLRGAYFQGVRIKKAAVFSGLYKYTAMPVITEDGVEYIRLGCYFRPVSEWEADFWNNPSEFPEDRSTVSLQRLMAYRACLEWLRIHRESVQNSMNLDHPQV
jgi:hypothetical protein